MLYTLLLMCILTSVGLCQQQCRTIKSCFRRGRMNEYLKAGPQGPKGDVGTCNCTVEVDQIQKLEEKLQLEVKKNEWFRLALHDNNLYQKKIRECGVGLRKDGIFGDSSFTASSQRSAPEEARLDKKINGEQFGGWMMDFPYKKDEWLQVNLNTLTTLVGIITQGDGSGDSDYVSTYTVMYEGRSTDFFKPNRFEYIENKDGSPKVFQGNVNAIDYAINLFDAPIKAYRVRIYVQTWDFFPRLRVELLKC